MKRIMLSFIILLVSVLTASAQNTKFGKPSKEEWELTSVGFAPEAEAVVLYKSVDVNYNLSGSFSALGSGGEGSLDDNHLAASGVNKYIDPSTTTMLYDVKLRTKILRQTGADYAAIDIITFNDKDDMDMREAFYEMSVVVFSKNGGKVEKRKISAKDFVDERIDKHYVIRHVRIPDVREGDIVEYQYQLFSFRSTYIYDTQFQESIPVLYSRCCMNIPYFLQFNVNRPIIDNVSATVALGNILIKSPNNDNQLPRKVSTNVYTIEARNLPAYAGEIDLKKLTNGDVHCVRTEIKDKRYDVGSDLAGPVRHLIIGR